MAKPDDRSDNVEKLQESVQNTIGNFREAEDYLNEFGDEIPVEERNTIEDKNERRKESIRGFRSEIKDEAQGSQNQ
ncbi:small acid-soluble spore protein Tlp [Paenibacillus crassostreae]|uniref:Small, acid-soluble spore protein Tlp n=1 Tax=Paenibacillus crassostreae TaxID=1763538 RepID=A0A167DWA1_9BACL|nr:small acid-soluble spore protein Tlp [Paenibacillus crassostreae]AOZ90985.1 small acid-soluble spore protein Tlp [Paenibacillus crassostreae]OAB74852.1 small, acid-soluble spore protein Tlp [Paenibacillus crassostreae]